MTNAALPVLQIDDGAELVPLPRHTLARYQQLEDVPPEAEWFAEIASRSPATRRAYEAALQDFLSFAGIADPTSLRSVARALVIAWRDDLARREPALSAATIRHRLAALSSLFEYLCDRNAVTHNPVKGVKRPKVDSYEGKTPALGDHEMRKLLAAPNADTLKAKRDRAIFLTLAFHGLRRAELCALSLADFRHSRRGVPHFKVSGKGGKTRYIPQAPAAIEAITDYLAADGRGEATSGPLFLSVSNRSKGNRLTPNGVYSIVQSYSTEHLAQPIGAHTFRSTAATNALENGADIAKVQAWLGHANIATTRLYDHRKTRAEDSPTFKVAY